MRPEGFLAEAWHWRKVWEKGAGYTAVPLNSRGALGRVVSTRTRSSTSMCRSIPGFLPRTVLILTTRPSFSLTLVHLSETIRKGPDTFTYNNVSGPSFIAKHRDYLTITTTSSPRIGVPPNSGSKFPVNWRVKTSPRSTAPSVWTTARLLNLTVRSIKPSGPIL